MTFANARTGGVLAAHPVIGYTSVPWVAPPSQPAALKGSDAKAPVYFSRPA